MKQGGHFYVCGDVGMASDVTTTLSKIIQEHGKMSAEQAQSYLLKLRVYLKQRFQVKPRQGVLILNQGNLNYADF